ncbi:MAG: NAD-dependent DNA ligase LigA, partial [Parasphingorhabdus sp.]
MSTDQQARIEDLQKRLSEADIAYHQDSDPIMTDAEYDKIRIELGALTGSAVGDSPQGTVGAPAAEGFVKVAHAVPMLSLANAFTAEDVHAFITSVLKGSDLQEGATFVGEPKIDGLSLALKYVMGNLVQAVTRGDGAVGEDVTAN